VPSRNVRFVLLLLLLAGTAACGRDEAAAHTEEPTGPPPVNVAAARVQTATLSERIELSGRLEPWVEVRVASELGGMVEEVSFQKGASIKQGQVLARIGSDMHQAALAEAEALLAGAEATYNRALQLVERQAVPRQQAINATAEYEAARARVAQNRLRLERSVIRGPVGGVAITRDIEPGEVLAPGTIVTTIHRVDQLKAVVGIPDNDIALFRRTGTARVHVDAWPGREFEGRMHFVAPSATGSTRTFPAEIAVDNRDRALRPGMIARVSLVRRSYPAAVVVPRDVLQERDTGTVAVLLDGDVARVRPVRLGAVEGDRVVIDEGLTAGEWLIVSGHRGLVDGQRVQVVERQE
jgi:membrane fusion protein, multidrug efflux system